MRLIGDDIHLNWLPYKDLWPLKIDSSQIDQILVNLCVNVCDAITGVGKITIETENITFDEDFCADHTGFLPGEYVLLAEEHAGEIHLLLTDVVMPKMNGRDLAKKLLSLYPSLKHLFMSGYTANVIAHQGVLDEGVYFIQKPFSIKDLAAKVRDVLDQK